MGMPEEMKLQDPWLLAVWPGMGGVAMSAGYYLMAKLGMHLLAEFPVAEFFELEQVDVKDGMLRKRALPRSRLFLWNDPQQKHDFIVFIGEAQPPARGAAFCRRLIEQIKGLGVGHVFTFAAMATEMRPAHDSRVFGAAIDRGTSARFRHLGIQPLASGTISGLNGVLLGIAADNGLAGGCLLGEIPHVFSQIPFPKASLAVLEVFTHMAGIKLDFTELRNHAVAVEQTLEEFLTRMERSIGKPEGEVAAVAEPEPAGEAPRLGAKDRQRLERLFEEVRSDRSRAYELKQELDRLGLFKAFEDRFLDLFKEA